MAEKRRIEYNWISGVETLEKYEPAGYHPVMIGDILHDRYHIADKLGQGGYSTVWLAHDTYLKQYVALKVNIASSIPRETKVLKALSAPTPFPTRHPGRGLVPSLLDEFESNKWPPLETLFEDCVQKWRRKNGSEIGEDEKAAFLNLMRQMLVFRPEERPTADEVLQSEWIVKWGLPDYQRSLKE
ncbi:hypothetical protein PENDEC_c014G01469 [Penicillium decumbens]|uniref:non-specific serine/threonine protein kinase n=1 Tax=Penicillium decumbens TaxID=69771 RepID=A0A1V6PA91_PENDC|nr:hypothetical protein PENDEC_c014G01469 [Penicillium decumbens]